MFSYIGSTLQNFLERNLFERLIIYIFLSSLVTTFLFQFILGQDSFLQSQNQQWIFYGLLGLDYLFSFKKIINIRITLNPMSLLAFFFFVMLAHGLFVGIINHNAPFVILNDAIPPLMIGLNILRMQSISEISKPIDFRFIFISTISITSLVCLFATVAGKPHIGNSALFYPLALSGIIALRPLPKWTLLAIAIMVILTLDDTNRTTLFFVSFTGLLYLGINSIYNPARGFLIAATGVIVLLAGWNLLPEGSKTHQRITGLTEIDLSKRTGSIGERQAENDAIKIKLEKAGTTAQWVGAGFGGLYEVRFTHAYLTNYGHAHYSWAWFNLRFGKIGLLYMAILFFALIHNGIRSFQQRTDTGLFIALLCLSGLIYCFTHVNSVFLLSGLHFAYLGQGPPLSQKSS